MKKTQIVKIIEKEFESGFYSCDPFNLNFYGQDWTRFYKVDASVVCWPRSVEELQALLKLCQGHRIPVVPSGGRTGLSAGAVATQGELVLSLEKLRSLEPVDEIAQTVRCGAGVVHQALQEHCATSGLMWPIDLGSRGQCQIGGNLATNAGGLRVIRYGHARQWVRSLEVVTAAGERLELQGDLVKIIADMIYVI